MKKSILLSVFAVWAALSLPARGDYVERTFLRRDMPPLCGQPWALQVGRSAVADLRQIRFCQGVVRVGDFEYPLDPWGIKQALEALENLQEWLAKGGCFPEVKRDSHRNFWIGVPKP